MKYLIGLNIFLVLAILIYNGQFNQESTESAENDVILVSNHETETSPYPNDLATIEIVLQSQYLDGRMDTKTYTETITAMEDFWYAYESYQLIDQRVGQMVFREYIDDISPYLKEVGYFGLADNQLVIYEGEPQYNQNIETVFDLDINMLSEAEQKQLEKGIKIDSKSTYQEVIDVFRHQIPSKQVHGEPE